MTKRKPLTRSQQMARIRGKDTQPELVVRKLLWAAGHRYRVHLPTPGGRPDLVFPRLKLAVYIDGCFWHGCPEHYVRPRSRNEFWDAKLAENVARDIRQLEALRTAGWRVHRIWEHQILESPGAVAEMLLRHIERNRRLPALWRVAAVAAIDQRGQFERRTLVNLRNPTERRTVEGPRTTNKVGRVTRRTVSVDAQSTSAE